MTLALRYSVRSDVGLIREGNEDSAYAGPHLLAIADGMGGHAAGEVASAVAISALAPLDADTAGLDMLRALSDAVASANATLREITHADPATEGMGTTLTALLWGDDQVAVCHIGDSRGYLLRDGTFYQITHDHTLVQSLVDEGRLTREAAATHPQRSLVMRALQSSIPADPDLATMPVQLGDRFLLCSDGLSDVVTDETLHKTLMQTANLDEAVGQLIDLAIRSGGPDNITVVLADVVDAEADPAAVSTEAVIVGAIANGEDTPATLRDDSPAARAHLLALGLHSATQQAPSGGEQADTERPDAGQGSPDDQGSPDGQNGAEPGGDGGNGSGPAPADRANPAGDSGDEGGPVVRGRRMPVVSGILLILIGVIGGGLYYGWRTTQHEYFVGIADGRVAVYRGINQPVAGISLSNVVEQTNIPVNGLPASWANQVRDTISPLTLTQARQTLLRIRQGYQCGLDRAAIASWFAHKPKPPPKPKTHRTRTRTTRHNGGHATPGTSGTTVRKTAQRRTSHPSAATGPAYPPQPVLHAYCSAYPGASG